MYAEYAEPKTEAEMHERYARIRREMMRPRNVANDATKSETKYPGNYPATEISRGYVKYTGLLRDYNSHVMLWHRYKLAIEAADGEPIEPIRYTWHEITMDILSNHPEFTLEDIRGKRRFKELTALRQTLMFAVERGCPHLSLPQIGLKFNRDHTTVMHARGKMEKAIDEGRAIQMMTPLGRKYWFLPEKPTRGGEMNRRWRENKRKREGKLIA